MRPTCAAFVLLLGACGGKSGGNGQSVCDQIPAPAECTTTCDPNGQDTCPAGYHCATDGTCDAECTPGGTECGVGYHCTSDGRCEMDTVGPDASCPAVHFTPTKVTPSITLVLDRSGSMTTNFNGVSRYQAMIDGLFGANGAVTKTQGGVYFGEALYAGDQSPCLSLNGFTAARALNNATAMQTLTTTHPPNNGGTPTAPAIDQVVADFAANPPPMGSPPVILLATDGDPNSCNSNTTNRGPSITAAQNAYNAGIRLFIVGLAGLNTQFLQDMANAGTGKATGQAANCAGCSPFYVAGDPQSLSTAFTTIINGVLTCDLMITGGTVDPAQQCNGTVTLNGTALTCGTDWNVDQNGMTIHLLGQACDSLKNSVDPMVDASFPCGSVVIL
jgi:hypothetical protein